MTEAQGLDHIRATGQNIGFIVQCHRIGNLLPSCTECNSKKRSMHWRDFLKKYKSKDKTYKRRVRRITAYTNQYKVSNLSFKRIPEYQALQRKLEKVLKLLNEADKLAAIVRTKSRLRAK